MGGHGNRDLVKWEHDSTHLWGGEELRVENDRVGVYRGGGGGGEGRVIPSDITLIVSMALMYVSIHPYVCTCVCPRMSATLHMHDCHKHT